MIALAAALLRAGRTGSLPHSRLPFEESFPVRSLPANFADFEAQALCCAVRPPRPGATNAASPLRLVVDESSDLLNQFGASRLSELRSELARWVTGLTTGSNSELRRLEAHLTASLLRNPEAQCTYRLAPIAVPDARPVVIVQSPILRSVGRRRFLYALWESEFAAGATGSEQELGALYDELVRDIRRHAA
jgi:hypothetical protein